MFAANSIGLVLGGILSNRLLRSGLSSQRIMVIGLMMHTLAGLTLFLVLHTNVTNLSVYAGLLALAIGALGLVFGNATALTMNKAGPQVGTASALMGMLHYLIAALVGYLVSLTPQGLGQLPLAISVCGLLALFLYYYAAHTTDAQRQ